MASRDPVEVDAGGQSGASKTWQRLLRRNARLGRLQTALDMYQRELAGLRTRNDTASCRLSDSEGGAENEVQAAWWRGSANELLDLAKSYARQRRIDAGWEALHSSQRLSLYELTKEEIIGRRESTMAEVAQKLSGWRRNSAEQLLKEPTPDDSAQDIAEPSHVPGSQPELGEDGGSCLPRTRPCLTWCLIEVQRLLDEQSNNVYLKLRLAGRRITVAALLLATTLIALGAATVAGAFEAIEVSGPFVLHDGLLFVGVVLLGIFGSMLSLALDLARSAPLKSRIYELASAHIAIPVARLAIGAGSAVVTVAAAQTALVGGPQPWMYLTAIPAGFSERLVRRSVEALEQGSSSGSTTPQA